MSSERHDQIGQLFLKARELPVSERGAFLDTECDGDEDLKREVESMLACEDHDLDLERVPGLDVRAGMTDLDKRLEVASTSAALPTRIGRYEIIRRLGEGGMGIVYLAEQSHPRRRVALKVIRPGWASDRLIRRFLNEAEVLGQLQHPGIAQIYEAGTATVETAGVPGPEQPFFAMEYVQGLPLNHYIEKKQLDVKQRLRLLATICDAVHHAHTKGVIHRDLKPGNILIVEGEGEGEGESGDQGIEGRESTRTARPRSPSPPVPSSAQPKILDFGVARVTDADMQVTTLQTDVGQLIGTIPYMSPEQIAGNSSLLDQRSDVYALGVICYECLAGKLPHELRNISIPEVARIIREEEPSRLSSLNSNYRGDIETIVAKALEKEKERRYASAAELAADIRRHLEHRPIVARPTTAAYQLRKFAKRNKVLVGGIAAVFVVLLAGVATTTSMYLRAEDARVEAQDNQTLAEKREHEATEARDQLQIVVDFQSSMLSEVDAEQMGRGIVGDQREHIRKRLEKNGKSPEEIEATIASFNELSTLVNPTDLALKVVDEHVLSRAVDTIERDFADQPIVSAALEQTVAVAYHDLGLYPPAKPLQEAALQKRREQLGDDHPHTLASVNNIGMLARSMGDYPEAEENYREALEGRRRVLGDDHPDTLQSMINVTTVLIDQGKFDEAQPLAELTHEKCVEQLGEEHERSLQAMQNLANLHDKLGRPDQSEPLHLRMIEIRRKTLGDNAVKSIDALNNLAGWYWDNDRYVEAEGLYEEVLQSRRKTFGEEHPATLRSYNNLGTLYHRQGKYDKAREVYNGCLDLHRRVLGDEHPDTLNLLSNLATLQLQSGKPKDAIPLFLKMLEVRKRVSGPSHPDALIGMNNLSQAYRRVGQRDEAERISAEVLAVRREYLGNEHPDTIVSLTNHAQMLTQHRKYEEAEPLHLEAITTARRVFEPGNPGLLHVLNNLAVLYSKTDRNDEALPIYVDLVKSHHEKMGEDHPNSIRTKQGLGECYRKLERYDDAERTLTEAIEAARRSLPAGHWITGTILMSLGKSLTASEKYADAEAALVEAYGLFAKALGKRHGYTRVTAEILVELYTAWKKPEKAAQWQNKLAETAGSRNGSDQ